MAETQGTTGFTTEISVDINGTPTPILEPKDITGPQTTAEFADFTHQQSPSGFRERKPTFKSSGDVTFKCNFVPTDTGQAYLMTAAAANPPTLEDFTLTFPDATGITFSAYVSLQWTAPMGSALEMFVTLSISGNISFPNMTT